MRVAVVTGGASGMGLAVCRRLAARGDRVAVLDIDGEGARKAAQELAGIGADAVGLQVDVSDRPSVDRAVAAVRSDLGPVEILVASAGIPWFEPFTEISLESWKRVIDVNLTGMFNSIQSVVGDMLAARWGRIVTISSSSAQRGAPRMAPYSASKGGVISLMKTLARELGPHGITVNDIPPSSVITPMQRKAQEQGNLQTDEMMARNIPVGRLGTADDVAAAAAFLCSDDAGYINGQVVGVNGGSVVC